MISLFDALFVVVAEFVLVEHVVYGLAEGVEQVEVVPHW